MKHERLSRRRKLFILAILILATGATMTACGDANTSAVARLAGSNTAQAAQATQATATALPANTPAPLPTPTPHLWPTVAPTVAPMPIQIAAPVQPAPQPTAQPVQAPVQAQPIAATPYTLPDMPNVEPCPVLDNGRIDPTCAATWRR